PARLRRGRLGIPGPPPASVPRQLREAPGSRARPPRSRRTPTCDGEPGFRGCGTARRAVTRREMPSAELIPQHPLEQLARGVAREFVDELDPLGHLVL